MQIKDIIDGLTGTNAEIAAKANALPTRYVKTVVNAEAVLTHTGNTDATNAIYTSLEASEDMTLKRSANIFETVGLNFGNPIVRQIITQIGTNPVLVGQLLALASDTHGGDITEQDVAECRAEEAERVRVDEIGLDLDAARAAANAVLVAGGTKDEVRAAWIEQIDERWS